MARAKNLAGLAALGFLGYKLFGPKGEDATGPAATTEEKKASDKRAEAQKDAVSGDRVTNKSSYTGKINAPNIGFGGGTNSDKKKRKKTLCLVIVLQTSLRTPAKSMLQTSVLGVGPTAIRILN